MDINQPPAEARHHRRRNPLHISGEHDESRVAQSREDLVRAGGIGQHGRECARPARPLERSRVRPARDDARHARGARVAQRVEQRFQVRAAARHQHGDREGKGGGWGGSHRLQGASDCGFAPAVTLSANAPVRNLSLLVTTT